MSGAYQADGSTLLFSLDSILNALHATVAAIDSGRFCFTGITDYPSAAAVFDPVTGWLPQGKYGLGTNPEDIRVVASATHFLVMERTGVSPTVQHHYLVDANGNATEKASISNLDPLALPIIVGLSHDQSKAYAYCYNTGDFTTTLQTIDLETGDLTPLLNQPDAAGGGTYTQLSGLITLPDGGYITHWVYSTAPYPAGVIANQTVRYNSSNVAVRIYGAVPNSGAGEFFKGRTFQTFWADTGSLVEIDVDTGAVLQSLSGGVRAFPSFNVVLPTVIQPSGVSGFTTLPPPAYTAPPDPAPVDPSPIVQHLAEVNAALDSTPYFDYTNNYQFFGQGLFEITLKVAQSLQSEGAGFLKWGLGREVDDANVPSWKANYNGTDVWSWIIAYPNGTFYYILRFGVIGITVGPYPDWTLGGITNSSWYVPL